MSKSSRRGTIWRELTNMPKGFSFFRFHHSDSWIIRGLQKAELFNGRINPTSDYMDDVCIWIKSYPTNENNIPPYVYVDVMDRPHLESWLSKHPRVTVITAAPIAMRYMQEHLKQNKIIYIPQDHCNFDRIRIPKRPIRVVGVIGGSPSIQWPLEEVEKMFAEIGLEFKFFTRWKSREDLIKSYSQLDIQIVYRPWSKYPWLNNLGKLSNAGSFGIPTVAFPEKSYYEEWEDYCLWGGTIEDIVNQVKRLKDDPVLYHDMSEKAIEKAEEYHIDNISKYYLELLK